MDHSSYLTSGEMAAANCVSRKALRIYKEKGIIEPHHIDESNGRGYYDIMQSTRMDLVMRLQGIGMSLDEIKKLIDNNSIEDLRVCVSEHIVSLEQEIRRLHYALNAANEIVDGCELYLDPPLINQIMIEHFPERQILVFNVNELAQIDDVMSCSSQEWELVLRGVKRRMIEMNLPLSLYGNVNSIITLPDRNDASHGSEKVFVYLDSSYVDDTLPTQTLPAGQYLTLYDLEGYDKDNHCRTRPVAERMLDYIDAKQLEICGPAIEEVLFRFPHLISSDGSLLWRLSIPVERKRAA